MRVPTVFRRIMKKVITNFARPDEPVPGKRLDEVDEDIERTDRQQRELAARVRLLEMQSTPRGFHRG